MAGGERAKIGTAVTSSEGKSQERAVLGSTPVSGFRAASLMLSPLGEREPGSSLPLRQAWRTRIASVHVFRLRRDRAPAGTGGMGRGLRSDVVGLATLPPIVPVRPRHLKDLDARLRQMAQKPMPWMGLSTSAPRLPRPGRVGYPTARAGAAESTWRSSRLQWRLECETCRPDRCGPTSWADCDRSIQRGRAGRKVDSRGCCRRGEHRAQPGRVAFFRHQTQLGKGVSLISNLRRSRCDDRKR
jgi:hypothetical protein